MATKRNQKARAELADQLHRISAQLVAWQSVLDPDGRQLLAQLRDQLDDTAVALVPPPVALTPPAEQPAERPDYLPTRPAAGLRGAD